MRKITFVFVIIICLFLYVPKASAITLAEYEAKVEKYRKEVQDTQNKINMTQSQINSSNKEIDSLKKEVLSLTDEVAKLNKEIEEYNEKIKEKLSESKMILEYTQLSSGSNVYLEYVFKAKTYSDLIYRSTVIKELIDYNNRTINDMKQMVKDNENREKEIEKRKETIANKQSSLKQRVSSLGEQKSILADGGVTAQQQLKSYQELVASYKKLGCKSKDVIGVDCAVTGTSGVFRRPTTTGYITQEAYYGVSYTHRGLDIGSKNGTKEKIYPVANGKIIDVYLDNYDALCVAIEHYNPVDRKYYTSLYAHMSSYAPGINKNAIGRQITSDQYIGYMGNTGYSFGIHLHLELFPCSYKGDNNCFTWNQYVNYGTNLLKKGYKGPRALIAFPSGTYNSWYSR